MKKITNNNKGIAKKRTPQTDVPLFDLNEALRIAHAIADSYACHPSKPVAVAQAMNLTPASSHFRMLCGASIAYGLTDGGYNAETIALTELAKRILKPTMEFDDLEAKKEAALKPKIIGEFLRKYNNNKLPKNDIAKNVLESLGVPKDNTERALDLIVRTAKNVGFFRQIKGENFIDLDNKQIMTEPDINTLGEEKKLQKSQITDMQTTSKISEQISSDKNSTLNSRVFISHGKNRSLVPSIQEFLRFGNFEPVISVERETVSKPVSDKVLDDMRSCGAAIIHVEAEKKVEKDDGSHEAIINSNVLIEIGAAMALYGRRFVLLVQNGVQLPSNLKGLYEVRYEGEKLDAETAIKLMKSFNDMKNYVPYTSTNFKPTKFSNNEIQYTQH